MNKYKEINIDRNYYYEKAINYVGGKGYDLGIKEAIKENMILPEKEKRKYLTKLEMKVRENERIKV